MFRLMRMGLSVEKSTRPYKREKVYRCKKCGCEKRYVIE
jgi:hypothetical protein